MHDFDIVRWVTGREVVEVSATGSNRGDSCFTAAGDVDTAVTVLTLDDGTLVTCTATRYNGAGYDVRMEVVSSTGTLATGLDPHTPLRFTAAWVHSPGPSRTTGSSAASATRTSPS